MTRLLRDATVAIKGLIDEIEGGEHDDSGVTVLGIPFQYTLWNLCLAWHSRWLTDEELDAMSQEDDDEMRDSIPNSCL